jgi:ribosome biogenesis GTPase
VRELQSVDPVAVGDTVHFIPPNGGSGMIVKVAPRRSKLSRPEATGSSRRYTREQVIVANLDQVVPVMALAQPAPSWNLLDRYLVSAASLDLPVLIVLTKTDLARGDREIAAVVAEYRAAGYPVLLTSTYSGEGLDELRAALRGRVSAFIGKSGVGKSTLLNAIQPGLGLRVKTVSESTNKGRHTTTHLEMFPLDGGGAVVDTPGTREFGLWQVDSEDIARFFPEVSALAGTCRFGFDCSHNREPGCTVRRAVDAGRISRRRYESMLKLGLQSGEG